MFLPLIAIESRRRTLYFDCLGLQGGEGSIRRPELHLSELTTGARDAPVFRYP